ncbi:CBS domain-containing protein [Rhodococcus spongiicola]|uniref:CBS domain-containing protein n=1 Tax=Rhodococcus spongiicola TaxID=2487352 RepID=A0A3S3E1I5_9NOCA|nr:CBS domain-containing protein [Rhodococcus spongiicola]RVW03254.1 CBS domain-containing protein [Rhodococcus spongiicola]
MRARHVMSSPVTTVSTGTTVEQGIRLLSRHGYTALPVVDHEDALVGIVSESDLLQGEFVPGAPGARNPERTVGEVMTSPVVAMSQDVDISALASAMLKSRLHSIPIVDGVAVIGIVTRRDLVEALAQDDHNIDREVRHRLEVYGGTHRWTVAVEDGVVSLGGDFLDDSERRIAEALAGSVPGVIAVRSGPSP